MRILYAVLAAYPYILCPCKSGRRRWCSVVSCCKLVTSYSSLCQIRVNDSNWKVKPFNFSALNIIKRRFDLWWHCLSWHLIMFLFKSLFNYCGFDRNVKFSEYLLLRNCERVKVNWHGGCHSGFSWCCRLSNVSWTSPFIIYLFLENVFSCIRGMGGGIRHPTASTFVNLFRCKLIKCILLSFLYIFKCKYMNIYHIIYINFLLC